MSLNYGTYAETLLGSLYPPRKLPYLSGREILAIRSRRTLIVRADDAKPAKMEEIADLAGDG